MAEETNLRRLLTGPEVAEYLGKPEWSTYELIRRGDLPTIPVGVRTIRVDANEFRAWVKAGGTNPGGKAGAGEGSGE